MFLTRLGIQSKAVITGCDSDRSPFGRSSGLVEARNILGDVEGLAFCYFNERRVVTPVRLIIKAYEEHAASGGRPRER